MKKSDIAEAGRKEFTEDRVMQAFDVLAFMLVCHVEATKCKGPDHCEIANNLSAAMKAVIAFGDICYPGFQTRQRERTKAEAEKLLGGPEKLAEATEKLLDVLPVSASVKARLQEQLAAGKTAKTQTQTQPADPPVHMVPPTKTVH